MRSVCHSCWLMGCLIFQTMKFKQEPRQLGWKRFFKGKLWQTARPYLAVLKSNETSIQRRQTWTHVLTMSSHYVSVYLTKFLVIISHWISVTHRDTVTRWHGDTGISAFLLRSQAVLGQVTQARARQEMIAACTRAGALPGYVVRKGPV